MVWLVIFVQACLLQHAGAFRSRTMSHMYYLYQVYSAIRVRRTCFAASGRPLSLISCLQSSGRCPAKSRGSALAAATTMDWLSSRILFFLARFGITNTRNFLRGCRWNILVLYSAHHGTSPMFTLLPKVRCAPMRNVYRRPFHVPLELNLNRSPWQRFSNPSRCARASIAIRLSLQCLLHSR